MSAALEVVVFAGAMNLGYSWVTVLTLFTSLCAFYLTTWEEYHIGTLYLGLICGLVWGMLTPCDMHAITAFKGGSFWQKPILEMLGLRCPDFLPPVLMPPVLRYAVRSMVFGLWENN